MRPVLRTGEEAKESAALVRDVIANGAAEHGVTRLKSVEDRALGDIAVHFEPNFAADVRQRSQVWRKDDSYLVHSSQLSFLSPI